jgi:hypothetical protein
MKKFINFSLVVALAFVFSACSDDLVDVNEAEEGGVKFALFAGTDCDVPARPYVAATDKGFAANIEAVQNNTRKNASGEKITSNAHSAKYPGIFFIWDSKQKDNGYLVVSKCVFDYYDSFVLTSKEANTYWDFPIKVQEDQEAINGAYIFFIPRAQNNKNINMVFVTEWKNAPPPSGCPIGEKCDGCGECDCVCEEDGELCFTYFEHESGGQYGYVGLSYTQLGNPLQLLPLAGADYTYEIVSRKPWPGLNNFEGVQLPVIGSMNPVFNTLGNPNVTGQQKLRRAGQYIVEGTHKTTGELIVITIIISPSVQDQGLLEGLGVPATLGCADEWKDCEATVEYLRYRAYVKLWNHLYTDKEGYVTTAAEKKTLHDDGGIAHYNALCAFYGRDVEPYFAFDDYLNHEDGWADALEVGLVKVYGAEELAAWVIEYGDIK